MAATIVPEGPFPSASRLANYSLEPRPRPRVAVIPDAAGVHRLLTARSHADLQGVRRTVTRLRRLSDRLVKIGPLGVGLDGVLSFFPVAGVVYSAASSGLLLMQGVRARASAGVLVRMGALLVVNTLLDVPGGTPLGIFSGVADTVFTAHKWAAGLLLKHMDETLYVEGSREAALADPETARLLADVRAGKEKRRVVFLD